LIVRGGILRIDADGFAEFEEGLLQLAAAEKFFA